MKPPKRIKHQFDFPQLVTPQKNRTIRKVFKRREKNIKFEYDEAFDYDWMDRWAELKKQKCRKLIYKLDHTFLLNWNEMPWCDIEYSQRVFSISKIH